MILLSNHNFSYRIMIRMVWFRFPLEALKANILGLCFRTYYNHCVKGNFLIQMVPSLKGVSRVEK